MLLICLILLTVFFSGSLQSPLWGQPPTSPEVSWEHKVDSSLVNIVESLPKGYFDFVTTEAAACRLSLRVATLESGTVARTVHWTTTSTREIIISEVSSWDAVNIENLVHELTHAGANGTGSDTKGYSKQGEVNASKKEAESWKNATTPKPSRGSGEDQGCWATYDMVYNQDGTQRSHDEIKKKLKTYGYKQANM